MAEITWTSEALSRLREIREYIAVDNPRSASKVVAGILREGATSSHVP